MEGKFIDLEPTHWAMARRKSRALAKIQKAERQITVSITAQSSYLDIAQELSKINRKMFSQGKVYGIESVEFLFQADTTQYASVSVAAYTAGDTWSVHNAHVKGEALFHQMNQLVLEDNPSIQGKWADFKVFLDPAHRTAYLAGGNLEARDGAGISYLAGEWDYSDYVMPQHSVDAAGNPLPADQTNAHLVGPDVGSVIAGNLQSAGLVAAYQESRATVFANAPNVPVGMTDSFFNLLTDSGSQEPELATIIEAENNNPPYRLDQYPGGPVNAPVPVLSEFASASPGFPNGLLTSFVAQCGLVKFLTVAYDLDGNTVTAPPLLAVIKIMPGSYKGVAAIDMGQ
jgi:hypothetical protein